MPRVDCKVQCDHGWPVIYIAPTKPINIPEFDENLNFAIYSFSDLPLIEMGLAL